MLRERSELEKGFRKISRLSVKKCDENLEKIRKFICEAVLHFNDSFHECYFLKGKKDVSFKCTESLVYLSFLESWRTSGQIMFLSVNGLYRNAYDDIRHMLESVVLALYIDARHPEATLKAKIEILKEVEDKTEYHASHLIGEFKIEHKDKLQSEYKKLSKIIHPSHKQMVDTYTDVFVGRKGAPAFVDCEEIQRIYESLVMMYDIFFFLFLSYFTEMNKNLTKNTAFINDVKRYRLYFTSKALKLKL